MHPVIVNLALTPVDHLRGLRPLLDVLRDAPAGPPATLPPGFGPETEDSCVPLYYSTEQDALDAFGVAGPWNLALVNIDIFTGCVTVQVVGVSPETYDNAVDKSNRTISRCTLVGNDEEIILKV